MKLRAVLFALATIAVAGNTAWARDQIRIVGSSTVFPFSTAVAEQFGRTSSFKTPIVESTGSGGGMKLFCAGVGENHPDITNASRRIKPSELKTCAGNGIAVTELMVGYDGIVLANARAGKRLSLTKQQIFQALAKQVWLDGKLVDNPYTTWDQIDPALPTAKIEVLGPPPTSGTRDAFVELAMEGGAKAVPELKALRKTDKQAFKKIAHTLREDGHFVEAGENDNLIVQKLVANPAAVGIFGFSFLDQNEDLIQGAMVDGVEPDFDNIASGDYGVSRGLYVYVKKPHLDKVPGIAEFLAEFTSAAAMGEDGYLTDKGLIPLPETDRQSVAKAAKSFPDLSL